MCYEYEVNSAFQSSPRLPTYRTPPIPSRLTPPPLLLSPPPYTPTPPPPARGREFESKKVHLLTYLYRSKSPCLRVAFRILSPCTLRVEVGSFW